MALVLTRPTFTFRVNDIDWNKKFLLETFGYQKWIYSSHQFQCKHKLDVVWKIIQIQNKVVLKQSLEQRVGERVFVVLVTTLRVSFALKKSVTSRPVGQLGKLPPIEEELSESSQILFWFWRNHQMMTFMFQFQQNAIVAWLDKFLKAQALFEREHYCSLWYFN